MTLHWKTEHDNPRLHYLYYGNKSKGMISRVRDNAYGVYQVKPLGTSAFLANEFVCMMPTLDEAKDLLQTITGAQL
jgi:hypothetical protein